MKGLHALLNELEDQLSFIDKKNEAVSKVTVGWHIEHSILALVKMISATEHSDPAAFKSEFNWKRTMVLAMGKIPRGRARVPASVIPGELITEETIRPLLEKARQKVDSFEKLGKDKYFTHPVFGDVQLKKARKIIAIHTQHHLHIINDILRA